MRRRYSCTAPITANGASTQNAAKPAHDTRDRAPLELACLGDLAWAPQPEDAAFVGEDHDRYSSEVVTNIGRGIAAEVRCVL